MFGTQVIQPDGPTLLMSNKDANEGSSSSGLLQVDRICFQILYKLDFLLLIVLWPWTIWNWRLAFSGITSHEHAQRLFKIDKEDLIAFGYGSEEISEDGESKKENSA